MSNFYGILSYPHGGRVSAFLLLAMAVATICTCYSLSSCQFVSLDFQSQHGNFDEHFYNHDPTGNVTSHRVGVGLFTWLRPFDDANDDDWNQGVCVGYNRLQRNEIVVDKLFEVLRGVAVIAVLMSISLFLFSLGISCLSFSRLQRYSLVVCSWLIAAMTGSAFLMTRSSLCTEVGDNPNCSIDRGGLIAVAGVVLWVLTSVIGMFCIQPVRETKLSPKMREQKKKEMRLHQLEMLKQLEELERRKQHQEEAQEKMRQQQHHRQQRNSTTQQKEGLPAASSSAGQPLVSMGGGWLSPDSLPTQGRKKKHKQNDSPKGTPQRSTRRRSADRLEIYETEDSNAPLQPRPQYSTRLQPIKKRRLFEGAGASSWLDDENNNVRIAKPNQSVCRGIVVNGKKAKDPTVRDQEEFDRAFERSFSKILASPGRSKNPKTYNENYSIPLFMSRDVSTVVNDLAVNQDGVEVYISQRLNSLDCMIDAHSEDELDIIDDKRLMSRIDSMIGGAGTNEDESNVIGDQLDLCEF